MGFVLFAAVRCGESSLKQPSTPASSQASERRSPTAIRIPQQIIAQDYDSSVPELHQRGLVLHQEERCDVALPILRRVAELDETAQYAPEALFHAADCEELAGRREPAALALQRIVERYPESRWTRAAHVKAIRLWVFLERWQRGAQLAHAFTARYADLAPRESVVSHSAIALGLLDAGNDDAAAQYIELGRRVVEEYRLDAGGTLPRDLAQLYYALGELRRLQGESVQLQTTPEAFARQLELRCQLLLDAQSAYSDAMRAYDAHWSSMAGFRVGELYARLHEELMRTPFTAKSAGRVDRAELAEGAMRLRYSVLLQKGRTMLAHTLQLAARTGEQSRWVQRATQTLRDIELAAEAEREAIARLPYTRQQLQDALDALTTRSNPAK